MTTTTNFVTAVAWVPQGVAAKNPQTVKLEAATIKELIDSNAAAEETSDTDAPEENEQKGLRGSAPNPDVQMSEDPEDKFNMKGYDEEKSSGPTMKGLAVFSKPEDDPYIATTKDDSEDEAERDAMQIKPHDNLAVVAKFDGEDTTLIVYVYNSDNGDFYIRQDYPIQAPILCLEHISYDPGADDKKGNLIAIGTMNPDIEIWDLDIINSVKPIGKLGSSSKEGRKKRDGSDQCHKDSVLSLSWNREIDHLLASGGADKTVILWDLDEAKPAQNLSLFDGMIQTLEWQPKEASILLSGTRAGTCRLDDCRTDDPVANWNFAEGAEIEVEKLFWDRHNEHNAYILTSDGKLRYIDTRQSGQVITTVQAHEGEETGGMSLSAVKGFLTTIGGEQAKFWKSINGQIELIGSKKFHMGKLRACQFNPDVPNILLLGGEKEDLIHMYDVARNDICADTFIALKPSANIDNLDEDEDVDAEMREG